MSVQLSALLKNRRLTSDIEGHDGNRQRPAHHPGATDSFCGLVLPEESYLARHRCEILLMRTAMSSLIPTNVQISKLNSTQLAIITNPELLAFHQDTTVGVPAKPFTPVSGAASTNPPEYYAGASSKGVHVFIINTSDSTATKTFSFSLVPGLSGSGSFVVHDMWAGKDLGTFSTSYSASVAAHDTVAFLISPV